MATWLPSLFWKLPRSLILIWPHCAKCLFDSVISVQPNQERVKYTLSKIQAYALVWQAVLLPMSLWWHTADSFPQAKDRLSPLICAQHEAAVHAGALRGAPCTPSLPGRISQRSVKAAQRQDLYQMKRGSPLISLSTDQHCNLAKGNEDAPEKKP